MQISSTNRKVRSDGLGRELEVPMNDYVDVGIFNRDGQLAYLQKHKVHSGQNVFVIEMDSEPISAGLDPLNKLIDKVSDGHVKKAVELPQH